MSYIREECGRTITTTGVPDFKKIANGDPGSSKAMSEVGSNNIIREKAFTDIVKQLLKLILIAAVYSPEGPRYVERIVQLSQSSQMVVMACVQEVCFKSSYSFLQLLTIISSATLHRAPLWKMGLWQKTELPRVQKVVNGIQN